MCAILQHYFRAHYLQWIQVRYIIW